MHIYFSGIGGSGISSLAMLAKQAGLTVSGSDKQDSEYIKYLKQHDITDVNIGQDGSFIAQRHGQTPIDWFVYSSAVSIENPDSPELKFCANNNIKTSKRDELINYIIKDKDLKLLAVAGTHGKSTTTAMLIWLLKQLKVPVSYCVGAKMSYGELGEYQADAKYFIYEADEYDRNFLAFHPFMSLITGIDWDHPDIYPTRDNYEAAFRDFVAQSRWTIFWQKDFEKLRFETKEDYLILQEDEPKLTLFSLHGLVNRKNAWQVVQAVHYLSDLPELELIEPMNNFPGLSRRFEEIITGLYSDYAHTPEKIRGALQTAQEMAGENVVVIYEGLHNTRQHFIKDELKDLFTDVKKLYVVPSYLAREDHNLPTLWPEDIIGLTAHPEKAEPEALNDHLANTIKSHLKDGDLVLALTAGGGGSLDEWLRSKFKTSEWPSYLSVSGPVMNYRSSDCRRCHQVYRGFYGRRAWLNLTWQPHPVWNLTRKLVEKHTKARPPVHF